MDQEQKRGSLHVGLEPVAYANGDELDNMLDDRTATVAGVRDGWRNTPLYVVPDGFLLVPKEPAPRQDKELLEDLEDMQKVMVTERQHRDGRWQNIEKGEALFHGFGADYEEFESGPGNFSAAIVEWPNGKVELVRADLIRFVTPNSDLSDSPKGCSLSK